MICRASAASIAALMIASPGLAQSVQGMGMKGMAMPGMTMASNQPAPKPKAKAPATSKAAPPSHHHARSAEPVASPPDAAVTPAKPDTEDAPMPGMDHGHMPGMNHGSMQGMGQSSMASIAPTATDLPAGSGPAPAAPRDHYADRYFLADTMARSRMSMMKENGGQMVHQVLFNLAEYQIRDGRDGYRWDGEAFTGGDINRFWIKSEGEGTMHRSVDSAEVQALFSHAIGPYYNLQAGVRQDIGPIRASTYATIGFEGLAPYQFETEGALFLSKKGDLLGRLEGWYDQRLTQRLVLQPRVELNFSAQDVPEDRYGAGLVNAELGLRVRYEIRREFAPYVGVSYERKTARTADFAREDGEDTGSTSLVVGVRTWF